MLSSERRAILKVPVKLKIGATARVTLDLRDFDGGLSEIAQVIDAEVFLPHIKAKSTPDNKCSYAPGCTAVHEEIEAILDQFTDAQKRCILHNLLWLRHSEFRQEKDKEEAKQLKLPLG